MQWSERREKFRALIEGDKCVHPGSVHDPISARITEDLGFEVGMFAGSIASMTVLGAPDIIVLTLTEFAQQAYRISRAGNLPLMVDADHGYGNAMNVMRTVAELEHAGVSGMSIEDTDLPQPFGTTGSSRLVSVEEGVGKMRAALSARVDPNLAIVGRTSAVSVTGVEDAVERGKAYAKAGVDGMFFAGVQTKAQLEQLAAEIKVPMVLGTPGEELTDLDYLGRQGVRISLQGHLPFMAAIQAIYETQKALRQGTPPREIKSVAPPEFRKQVMRDGDYRAWMKDFLGG